MFVNTPSEIPKTLRKFETLKVSDYFSIKASKVSTVITSWEENIFAFLRFWGNFKRISWLVVSSNVHAYYEPGGFKASPHSSTPLE